MAIFKWISSAALILSISSAGAAEPTPGLWDLTATVTIEGAAQPYGPYSRSQCFSKEDLRNPEKLMADNGIPNCSYSNIKNQNSRFDFSVQCGGDIPMSGEGSVTYSSDKLEGSVNITADLQGLPIATTSQVAGIRTGECVQ